MGDRGKGPARMGPILGEWQVGRLGVGRVMDETTGREAIAGPGRSWDATVDMFVGSEFDVPVPTRFAQVVARHADRPAIISDRHEWTYADLGRAANGVACAVSHHLVACPAPVA